VDNTAGGQFESEASKNDGHFQRHQVKLLADSNSRIMSLKKPGCLSKATSGQFEPNVNQKNWHLCHNFNPTVAFPASAPKQKELQGRNCKEWQLFLLLLPAVLFWDCKESHVLTRLCVLFDECSLLHEFE